jgi:hypothetical protein
MNPFRPETTVTLADGKPRVFKWTYGAKMLFMLEKPKRSTVFENETPEQKFLRLSVDVSLELPHLLLAAFTVSPSIPGERLTVELINELMPVDKASIAKLATEVWRVVHISENGPGESQASGSEVAAGPGESQASGGAVAKPSRSRGKRK